MQLTSYLAAAAAAASFVTASPVMKRQGSGYESAVYWGQNNERSLAEYCASDAGFDILILSFLFQFGNGQYPNGNFDSCSVGSDGSISGCDGLASDIETCKSNGKKVFVSIGGADTNWQLTSSDDAKGVAYSLWNSYANPDATDTTSPRPFGDTFINGWDFDIEQDNGSQYLPDLVNALRDNFGSDSANTYYISGAPQCPLQPNIADMDDAIKNSQFDYLFIQFYNNNCSAGDLVKDSNDNPNGAGSFNFEDWPGYLSGTSSEGAKLHVGMPAASTSAEEFDYVEAGDLPTVLDASTGVANFNGFMLYDAGDSDQVVDGGCTYGQTVRSVLDTGAVCSG